MSAIEWLHFINPSLVILIVIALTVSLPVPANLRKAFQLSHQSLRFKKSFIIFMVIFILCGLCWLFAVWASHIMTAQLRVNTVAISQVLFGMSVIATTLIVIIRLVHRNNLLSLLFALCKKYFPPFIRVCSLLASAFALLFVKSLDDETLTKNTREKSLSDEDKVLNATKTNYRGEFCDNDKLNWH